MADGLVGIKRFYEVAATNVATPPQGVRGQLRGKDFMLYDLTFGADRDGH